MESRRLLLQRLPSLIPIHWFIVIHYSYIAVNLHQPPRRNTPSMRAACSPWSITLPSQPCNHQSARHSTIQSLTQNLDPQIPQTTTNHSQNFTADDASTANCTSATKKLCNHLKPKYTITLIRV